MTVDEVREAKIKSELEIFVILDELRKVTGLVPEKAEICLADATRMEDSRKRRVVCGVEIFLERI